MEVAMAFHKSVLGLNADGVSLIGALLGIWLLVSALLWPHTQDQVIVSGSLGILIAAMTAAERVSSDLIDLRIVVRLLATLLLLSVILLPRRSMALAWNDAIVATAVFFISFIPESETSDHGPPGRPHPRT
jgi:hypothetical protein